MNTSENNNPEMTNVFPPGKYWIGDPCYFVPDGEWMTLLEETGYLGLKPSDNYSEKHGTFFFHGYKCFAHGTAYGDGCYSDNKGFNEYGVDAGLIGIFPEHALEDDGTLSIWGGQFVEFDSEFEVGYNDGTFVFGDLEINTGDNEEDEDEDEDEDEEEYYEDED